MKLNPRQTAELVQGFLYLTARGTRRATMLASRTAAEEITEDETSLDEIIAKLTAIANDENEAAPVRQKAQTMLESVDEAQKLNARMGLPFESRRAAASQIVGKTASFPTLTREDAQRIVAARAASGASQAPSRVALRLRASHAQPVQAGRARIFGTRGFDPNGGEAA